MTLGQIVHIGLKLVREIVPVRFPQVKVSSERLLNRCDDRLDGNAVRLMLRVWYGIVYCVVTHAADVFGHKSEVRVVASPSSALIECRR